MSTCNLGPIYLIGRAKEAKLTNNLITAQSKIIVRAVLSQPVALTHMWN